MNYHDENINDLDDSTQQLQSIAELINSSEEFSTIVNALESQAFTLFSGDRITLYTVSEDEITSYYYTGMSESSGLFCLPIGPSSISGYVATTELPIRINDVYDSNELFAIYPDLGFDYSYDQDSGYVTKAMIVAPIKNNNKLIGVLQIINQITTTCFTDVDVMNLMTIADMIGNKFYSDLRASTNPYETLIQSQIVTAELYDGDTAAWDDKLIKLDNLKWKLLQEE